MNTDTHMDRYLELEDDLRLALIDAGFAPLDDDLGAEYALTTRDAKVLGYFEERGWMAFRLEDDSAADGWATLARWSEDGIDLLAINRNGVENAAAHFGFSPKGIAWTAAAVTA